MAIIFIDLDRFKYINDHYGHAAGDELLISVAGRISSSLRKTDTVIRISGDEFIVLMPQIQHPADAGLVAEKMVATVSQPYLIAENKIYISASAGIAVFPGDGDDVETLMSHADVAMYKAKENGRNQHMFFNQHMNDEAETRAEVEADLLVALKENQLV
ncbi:MAG: GGDEF domain-containing protein, partial [Mariprofundaceae bacterium]|nr:GGDEF domain-containing protein [Mariprofundaceae bacterium]